MQSSRQYKSRNNILANRNNAGRDFECVSNAQEIHHDSTKVQSPVVVADGSETIHLPNTPLPSRNTASSTAHYLHRQLSQVFILSEKLHSTISQFDQLRGVRFQDAINRAMPRKKPGRAKTSIDISYSGNSLESREPTSSKTRNHGEIPAEPMKVQQHLLDDETRALQQIMWYWTSSVRYKLKMEGSSDRKKGPS
ncbi:hypothetical protein Tco_0580280, partial [Tanacetum coccineum]